MDIGSTPGVKNLSLMVRRITREAANINSYELVEPTGASLPPVEAGAHIDIHLSQGMIRQYSLCNDPAETDRYVIAVLHEPDGHGGSVKVHRDIHVADQITVSLPRNNFKLKPGAGRYILLGGGIGVTPLKAMTHWLEARGAEYELHYCARTLESVAFREELTPLSKNGRVFYHISEGQPEKRLNIEAFLHNYQEGDQLYYCGPPGFMSACAQATAHWPASSVHCEHFTAPVANNLTEILASADHFKVEIASSKLQLIVPPDRSIVEVLHDAGIMVETSCISGLCGSCKVKYIAGEVDHRDYILDDDERSTHLTTCVSRCNSSVLVLDL